MAISVEHYRRLSSHVGYFENSTNIGVIECDSGIYIIDSGQSEAEGIEILNCVNSLFEGKKIIALINTHSHPDHVMGNVSLIEESGCQLWNCAVTDALLRVPEINAAVDWGGYPLPWLTKNKYMVAQPCTSDRIIEENEELVLDGVDIKFYFFPGHFYGQVGIYVKDQTDEIVSFFLGDAFFGNSMFKKFWLPYVFDPDGFRQSIIRISSTICDYYVPSHYELMTSNTIEAVAENNIMVTYELEELICRILDKGDKNQEEILCGVADYAGLKMKEVQYILIGATVRSYLSSMEKRGIIKHRMCDNSMLWSLRKI